MMAARDKKVTDSRFYRLVNEKPVPCTREEALAQMAKGSRSLLRNVLNRCTVTTSFGVANMAGPGEPPLLFDTLIVPDDQNAGSKLWRTGTMEQAREKHRWAVELVRRHVYQQEQDDLHIKD